MTRTELTGQQSSEWPGGEALERAARYVTGVRSAPSPAARIRALASREGVRALTDVLRTVPVVPAPFSQAPAGEELRAWFNPARVLPVDRAPVAVLPLPATYADYLRGRPRQALRTNLTRAAAAGLTCAAAESPEELWRSARFIADRRGQRLDDVVLRRPRPGLVRRFAVAYDPAGDPVGLTETVVDGAWAGLAVLVSTPAHAEAQLIRYVLHAHNASTLIADGVSMLVVGGSMLLSTTGTRYSQRRTGFVPAWVRPTPSPVAAPRRGKARESVSLTLADLAAAIPAQRTAPVDETLVSSGVS
ncbi:MAG TPA: hypothetical protein VGN47_11715 [Blastococcus sp.]|jgi:hypothetical protein|nr:hypothetical protein [Blastococcus sp.]